MAARMSDVAQAWLASLDEAQRAHAAWPNRGMIERLWNPGAAAFFDGKDDPTVRVLEINVTSGEWWDGPSGRVGQVLSMVKATLGGDAGSAGPIAT